MNDHTEHKRIVQELRRINQTLAADAKAARLQTSRAIRASAKAMRQANGPQRSVKFGPARGALRFPKAPPKQYSHAGIRYHNAVRSSDGGIRTSFHMRMSNCHSADAATAHIDYIERINACSYRCGNISDDPEGRRQFWRSLGRLAVHKTGSVKLPNQLPEEFLQQLAPVLHDFAKRGHCPAFLVEKFLAGNAGDKPLSISKLNAEDYDELHTAIHDAWRETQDPEHPDSPSTKAPLPGDMKHFAPRSSLIQRRIILELPHDVSAEARERILKDWCRRVFEPHSVHYEAVIHDPPEGNDARNFHAHIVWCQHDVQRDPATGAWDFEHADRMPPTNRLGSILSRNTSGLTQQERNELARETLRQMRTDFAETANRELSAHLSNRRYDPRSYRDQGLSLEPGTHRGSHVSALQKQGKPTRWNNNRQEWRNAAESFSEGLDETSAELTRDALEMEMLTDSLPKDSNPFHQHLREHAMLLQRARIFGSGSLFESAADIPAEPESIKPEIASPNLPGQAPPWSVEWTVIQQDPSATALDRGLCAERILMNNPHLAQQHHAPAIHSIRAHAHAIQSIRTGCAEQLQSFAKTTGEPETGTDPAATSTVLHDRHRQAIRLQTTLRKYGLSNLRAIAPIAQHARLSETLADARRIQSQRALARSIQEHPDPYPTPPRDESDDDPLDLGDLPETSSRKRSLIGPAELNPDDLPLPDPLEDDPGTEHHGEQSPEDDDPGQSPDPFDFDSGPQDDSEDLPETRKQSDQHSQSSEDVSAEPFDFGAELPDYPDDEPEDYPDETPETDTAGSTLENTGPTLHPAPSEGPLPGIPDGPPTNPESPDTLTSEPSGPQPGDSATEPEDTSNDTSLFEPDPTDPFDDDDDEHAYSSGDPYANDNNDEYGDEPPLPPPAGTPSNDDSDLDDELLFGNANQPWRMPWAQLRKANHLTAVDLAFEAESLLELHPDIPSASESSSRKSLLDHARFALTLRQAISPSAEPFLRALRDPLDLPRRPDQPLAAALSPRHHAALALRDTAEHHGIEDLTPLLGKEICKQLQTTLHEAQLIQLHQVHRAALTATEAPRPQTPPAIAQPARPTPTDTVSEPSPPWLADWQDATRTHAETPLHLASKAKRLLQENPDIQSRPGLPEALEIREHSDLFDSLREAWCAPLTAFVRACRDCRDNAQTDGDTLQLHHRLALEIHNTMTESGLETIAPLSDGATAQMLAESIADAQQGSIRRRRLREREHNEEKQRELRCAHLRREWTTACLSHNAAAFLPANSERIEKLLGKEEADTMRRQAIAELKDTGPESDVGLLRKALTDIPRGSSANHDIVNATQDTLDSLHAVDPETWHEYRKRQEDIRSAATQWKEIRNNLPTMSDEDVLLIPPTALHHAARHDRLPYVRVQQRAEHMQHRIVSDIHAHLALTPEHAAWRLTRKYASLRPALRTKAPHIHAMLVEHDKIARAADAILLERAREGHHKFVSADAMRTERLWQLDPALAATTTARYSPKNALQAMHQRAPGTTTRS